jgi:subtilisin-like proprotein convertase family protein
MKLPKNSVIKLFGLTLVIAGLLVWQAAQRPSRVLAEFPGKSSPAITPGQPLITAPVSGAPTEIQTFCNTNSIALTNNTPPFPIKGNPYPSDIVVNGMSGTVSQVTVTLNNINHTFPDDIDILLVSPSGANAIIMSDAGGNIDANNVTLTLDDAAVTSLPDAGPLVTGTFKPTNFLPVDTFPSPAPTPSGGSALSAFNVTAPNGTWSLYVVDDSSGDLGSISGGWCLTITTEVTAPCTLICPTDITQPNDSTQCAAMVSYPAPTTVGVCGAITCSPPSGSFFFVGTTTVTCTSAAGSQCSFTVTVVNVDCPTTFFCNPQTITMQADSAVSPYPSNIGVSGLSGTISSLTVTLNNLTHTFPDDIDILLVGPTGVNLVIMSDAGGSIDANNVTLTLDDAAATSLPDAGPLVTGTFKPTNFPTADPFAAPAPTPSGATTLSVFNGTSPNGVWQLFVRDDATGDAGSFAGGWCLTIATVTPCTITCPANQSISNDPNQCGAVATYAPTTTGGNCGTVTCSPTSGSFFPVGTTTVTCTDTSGPSCMFTVTVVDAQPPVIICPANQTATAPDGQSSTTVTYPDPTVTDNCLGSSFACSPPSGSSFPIGVTTVTCTATDASANQSSCTFKVAVGGTIVVTADSFLRDGADNTNEGANERMRIQNSGNNRAVVRFNLAGVPTAGLQSATLTLNIAENSDNWGPTGRFVDAHRLTADWTEGNGRNDIMVGGGPSFRGTGEGVTWKCAKDTNINNQNDDCVTPWNGGTFAAATAPSVLHINNQTGPVSWNVTADVIAGASNGWLIKKQLENQNGQVRYYTKEGAAAAGNPSLAPKLVLVYAP